jgi:hypothetical protein
MIYGIKTGPIGGAVKSMTQEDRAEILRIVLVECRDHLTGKMERREVTQTELELFAKVKIALTATEGRD